MATNYCAHLCGAVMLMLVAATPNPSFACDVANGTRLGSALAGLGKHGDLQLGSGERLRLLGIRLVTPEANRAAIEAVLAPWHGRFPASAVHANGPDRWGRHVGAMVSDGTGQGSDLAMALLSSGHAITWPAELPLACRSRYLEAEQVARAAKRGNWADARKGLLDAAQGADVASRAGEVAVMQGRVMHVGQTRRATYLNFGARGQGASAEIGASVWRELERQGWTRERLRGQNIRARGVISEAQPARMLLTDAASIERVD